MTTFSRTSRVAVVAAIVAGLLYLTAVGWKLPSFLSRSAPDRSSEIAAAVQNERGRPVSCFATGFGLLNRLDGSKEPIYSCRLPGDRSRCFADERGIVRDITNEVRLLFANTYGAKPDCI